LPALRAIKLPENGRETNARAPRNRADHNGAATQRQATDFYGNPLIFNAEIWRGEMARQQPCDAGTRCCPARAAACMMRVSGLGSMVMPNSIKFVLICLICLALAAAIGVIIHLST
jgi:hypothetical protein